MSCYDFEKIRNKIINWYQYVLPELLTDNICAEIAKNDENVMIIDMTYKNCLAQISVSDPIFAPYKNVSFEAVTGDSKKALESGQAELIYFFYDSADLKEDEVIDELSNGVNFCSNYIPDMLEKKFINTWGVLNTSNERLNYVVHPDDVTKIMRSSLDSKFICTGTQFQYLIVKNEEIALRVLPRVFKN
jgi:hypothetical protein